jgi:hypothetical protein
MGPGNGNALPLTAGELDTPFAYDSVEAIGKRFDELQRMGPPGCIYDGLPRC